MRAQLSPMSPINEAMVGHVNPIPEPTPGLIWTASTKHAQDTFVESARQRSRLTAIRAVPILTVRVASWVTSMAAEGAEARRWERA